MKKSYIYRKMLNRSIEANKTAENFKSYKEKFNKIKKGKKQQ